MSPKKEAFGILIHGLKSFSMDVKIARNLRGAIIRENSLNFLTKTTQKECDTCSHLYMEKNLLKKSFTHSRERKKTLSICIIKQVVFGGRKKSLKILLQKSVRLKFLLLKNLHWWSNNLKIFPLWGKRFYLIFWQMQKTTPNCSSSATRIARAEWNKKS